MPTTPDPIGVTIARLRKHRGLTQHGLAARMAYSRSHLAQVEAGSKQATPAFIAATAKALGLNSADLYGQPFTGATRQDDRVHAPTADIRRTLASVDVPPDLDGPPRPVEELAADLAHVRELQMASRHAHAGARLPSLLEELLWHAHDQADPDVWALVFTAQEAAADLCRKLGYHDLASTCLDAARESARLSEDPHLPLLVTFRRSLLLAAVAQWRPALTLLNRAVGQVEPGRADTGEMLGTAHLRSAIIAARGGDRTAAWDHLGEAEEIRADMADAPGDLHGVTTQFTRANVAIHRAAVAIELGDPAEAVHQDRAIGEPTRLTLIPERRAHHEIDMARAEIDLGRYPAALDRLLTAERTAPQMTRYHPSARTTVTHLVDLRRSLPQPLRALHSRMGLAR